MLLSPVLSSRHALTPSLTPPHTRTHTHLHPHAPPVLFFTEHWTCCWECVKNVGMMVVQSGMATALIPYEFLVLIWATIADAMVFVPTKVKVPLASADDQAYDTTMLGRRESSGAFTFDHSCSGRMQRYFAGRRRWCSSFFCGACTHGTKSGNKTFRRQVLQKQLEVRTRLWQWIVDREDAVVHVRRRRSTAASLAVMKDWMSKQGQTITGGLKSVTTGASKSHDAESAAVAASLTAFRPPPVIDMPFFFPQRFVWGFIIW